MANDRPLVALDGASDGQTQVVFYPDSEASLYSPAISILAVPCKFHHDVLRILHPKTACREAPLLIVHIVHSCSKADTITAIGRHSGNDWGGHGDFTLSRISFWSSHRDAKIDREAFSAKV